MDQSFSLTFVRFSYKYIDFLVALNNKYFKNGIYGTFFKE
jgi:hypothetical protein